LKGLKYCHEKGIIHKNITPDKIVFSTELKNSSVRLCGFGLTKKCLSL